MRPILFHIIGIPLFSYPLFMGLAWGVAYRLSLYLFALKEKSCVGLRSLFIGIFLSSWLGAKLLFLLVSDGKTVDFLAGNSNFWLGGGFVFFGGLLGAVLFVAIYSLGAHLFPAKNLFLLLPSLALGHAIGRLGCFFAGCCYGLPSEWPWSFSLGGIERHPVQLYESLALFILGFFLLKKVLEEEGPGKNLIFFYFLSYSVLRFCLEFWRGDKLRGIYWEGHSTSQLIALGLIVGLLFTISWKNVRLFRWNQKNN